VSRPGVPTAAAAASLGLFARLRARLAARPDTEHEQALVRVAVGFALGLYLLPEILARQTGISIWLLYTLVSVALLASIVASPGVSPVRRTIGAALDAATTTWCMVHFEAVAAPMILIYVWSTVGMGFRFGPRQLLVALGLSVAGFATVLTLSSFWREHFAMGLGFMTGLIVLCLYVRKLVNQLFAALSRAEAANQAKRTTVSCRTTSHAPRVSRNVDAPAIVRRRAIRWADVPASRMKVGAQRCVISRVAKRAGVVRPRSVALKIKESKCR